jgi:hypothetical protein
MLLDFIPTLASLDVSSLAALFFFFLSFFLFFSFFLSLSFFVFLSSFPFSSGTFIGHTVPVGDLKRNWLLTSFSVDGNSQHTAAVMAFLLPRMPVISHFSARGVDLIGPVLHLLPRCLSSLKVSKTLTQSSELRSLESSVLALLDVSECAKLADGTDFRLAVSSWKKITVLHCSGCRLLTDESFSELSMERLEVFVADNTNVTKGFIAKLKEKIPFVNARN